MSSKDTQAPESARRQRELVRTSAARREELLRELSETRAQERVRQQEADVANTARLRALRLAKEASDARSAGLALSHLSAPPREDK
jgi:hypothetical protein